MILTIGYRYFMNVLNCYKHFYKTSLSESLLVILRQSMKKISKMDSLRILPKQNSGNDGRIIKIFIFALLVLLPAVSIAAGVCVPAVPTTAELEIRNKFSCDPSLTGITFRLTECSKSILQDLVHTGFDDMLKGMSKAVFAVMTMFVALTGYKMILGGVRNLKGEALTMILKIVFVAYMALWTGTAGTSGLQNVYDLVTGISTGMVDLVSTNIGSSGKCSTNAAGGAETNLWKRIDCTILVFIGRVGTAYETKGVDLNGDGRIVGLGEANTDGSISKVNEKNVSVLKTSTGEKDLNCDGDKTDAGEADALIEDFGLFELGLSQLFTPHGIFIMFLLGAASLMLFFAMYKAVSVYVISFVAITFLFLISPIFFPLFLFARTRQMFLTWVAMIIGYMIQPAMLMAFVAFLLATMNVAVHGTTDAGGHVINPGLKQTLESMNSKMKDNECTRKVIAWKENKMFGGAINAPIPDFAATFKQNGVEIDAITVPTTPINYKDLSVFMVQLLGCIVLLYIMMGLMTNVSDFVASLSVGAGSNLSKIGGEMKQLAGMAKDAVQSTAR